MATPVYTDQYRPLQKTETGVDDNGIDALSVRIRDLANSINNAKAYVMSPYLICDGWPAKGAGTGMCISTATGTTEDLILQWAPRFVGFGYGELHWAVSGEMVAGASDDTTWRLYAGHNRYRGALTNVTAADLATMGPYTKGSILISSTSPEIGEDETMELFVNDQGFTHLMLTAQNGTGTETSSLYTMAARPQVV